MPLKGTRPRDPVACGACVVLLSPSWGGSSRERGGTQLPDHPQLLLDRGFAGAGSRVVCVPSWSSGCCDSPAAQGLSAPGILSSQLWRPQV